MNILLNITKPCKTVVPMSIGLGWGIVSGVSIQEKMDGCFATREWRGNLLAGETMPDGRFIAFDILATQAAGDVTKHPLRDRLCAMACMGELLSHDGIEVVMTAHRFDSGHGGRFLQRILAAGGEGVVMKSLDCTWYDPMTACKRVETWQCVVTKFNGGTQSVQIDRLLADGNRVPAGNVALRGGKCERVRVGSILKVEGFGLTYTGLIREPRLDKDSPTSWLVKY